MKKLIAVITLSFALTLTVAAQNENKDKIQPPPPKNDWRQKAKTKKEPGIDKNQGQQVKRVNQTYKAKSQEIKNDANLSEEQKKEQLKTVQKDKKEEMKTILNHSEAELLVLENSTSLKAWNRIKHSCPHIKNIVMIEQGPPTDKEITSIEKIFSTPLAQEESKKIEKLISEINK